MIGSGLGVISTVLTPAAAVHAGWSAVLVLRMVTGAAGAITWPVLARALSVWLLDNEQATALGFITSGHSLGSFVLISSAGYFCCYWTWKAIFYFAAGINLIAFILTTVCFYSTPETCRFIRTEEKLMLREAKGELVQISGNAGRPRRVKIPWLKILTSLPVIAVVFCHYVERTTQVFNLMIMPLYMREVLHVRQDQIGIDVGIPVIAQVIGRAMAGALCDRTAKLFQTVTRLTKAYNSLGFASFAILILGVMFVPAAQHHWLILCAVGQYLLGSLVIGGFMKAAICLSPQFSGILYGLMITFAYVSAIVLPYVAQAVTRTGSKSEWNYVFLFIVILCLAAVVVFLVIGTAETQSWDKVQTPHDSGELQTDYGTLSTMGTSAACTEYTTDIVDAVV